MPDQYKIETPSELRRRQNFEKRAAARFIRRLDKAIEAMYEARLENMGCVRMLPIKELYEFLTSETTVGRK